MKWVETFVQSTRRIVTMRPTLKRISLPLMIVILLVSGVLMKAAATQSKVNLDQFLNLHHQWDYLDLTGENSNYREGDGVSYRAKINNLTDGTWTIRLQYDFTKGGVVAIDRLTRSDLTQASDPCGGDATCAPAFQFRIPGETSVGARA